MKAIDRFFIVLFVCVMCLGVVSIAEEITLTTYYPAPYGAYEELTTTGNTYLATDSGRVGIGTTTPSEVLHLKESTGTNRLQIRLEDTGGGFDSAWDIGPTNSMFMIEDSGGGTIPFVIEEGSPTGTMRLDNQGNVGIGTSDPTATLHVMGNIKAVLSDIDGGSPANMRYNSGTNVIGYDVAELFDTSQEVEPGDLLVIDTTEDLKLRKSSVPYERGIVGVVSGSPAILFEGSRLEIAPKPGGFSKGTKPPVALAGRIKCKVSLENGSIEKGDLLTSSSVPGYAMKATDRDKSFGAIVGKALEPFDGGPDAAETGEIIILITLQ